MSSRVSRALGEYGPMWISLGLTAIISASFITYWGARGFSEGKKPRPPSNDMEFCAILCKGQGVRTFYYENETARTPRSPHCDCLLQVLSPAEPAVRSMNPGAEVTPKSTERTPAAPVTGGRQDTVKVQP